MSSLSKYSHQIIMLLSLSIIFATASSFASTPSGAVMPSPFKAGDLPAGWQEIKDLFHTPYTWVSPLSVDGRNPSSVPANARRTVITFGGISNIDINEIEKQTPDTDTYVAGRMAWIESRNGKLLGFKEYKSLKWPGIINAHRFGVSYSIMGAITDETSVWISCPERFYNFKIIFPVERREQDEPSVDLLIQKFKCEKQPS
jgi:hypothetical protein